MARLHSLLAVAAVALSFLLAGPVLADPISAKAPGGDRVASASGQTIEVYDPKTNKLLMKMRSHKADIQALLYSPDGKMLASGDKDGNVNMADAATGKLLWRSKAVPGVNALSFSQDGKKVTAKAPGGKTTFSAATGKKLE
jgi:WD40 repeat protein